MQDCPFYDEKYCVKEHVPNKHNIKKLGYTICEKREFLPGNTVRTDLIFRKPKSLKEAIAVIFSCYEAECDWDDTTPRNLRGEWRTIFVNIRDENTLNAIWKNGLEDATECTHGFKQIVENDYSPTKFERKLCRFTMYESGKNYVKEIYCHQCRERRNGKVVKDLLGDADKEHVKIKALKECQSLGIKGYYCEICFQLKQLKTGKLPICNRYKTKGTPQFPTEHKPVNCEFFKFNNELSVYDNVKIEPINLDENKDKI